MNTIRLWTEGHTNAGATLYRTTKGYRLEGSAIGYKGIKATRVSLAVLVADTYEWLTKYGVFVGSKVDLLATWEAIVKLSREVVSNEH